ncbi:MULTISPECIES: glycosyltransferase [unclassified Novosphingobium]|uniref:glycosyltransferase n=1 Tax=unclassified Novosphingobium TaxID=2644732 RepID=UPI0014943E05|nr:MULTISPECIES: glycosyltransferase [unclassified Novosphingobium]MBB3356491.1 glycosyltransferase involved in cell wall biosynthesis [Novosphingobium sp. BK256]MBB3372892.1 glycosyltransferase involved in cell wall biosynthesis [Novosphingobium sp. BK280]MBB3377260.1 glycosyltransferase involved in cell wall biosynthesis [Novosphingobium sp. BK258]MBB3419329.1 glycosyltransferase involved in cell wall biosynthesis [Novosphingobium sp. BK267]MBB3448854.1 glycosyltransferase involved in cell w
MLTENDCTHALTAEQKTKAKAEFDEVFYKASNPDLALSNEDLLEHYLHHGWRQGRDPNARFDTIGYILAHPDVLRPGNHPFFHHLFGDIAAADARASAPRAPLAAPISTFAPAHEPEVIRNAAAPNATGHISPAGQTVTILSEEDAYRGLSEADIRQLKQDFSADFYLQTYPDVRISGADPFFHYMTQGWLEGRDPSADFSTRFYLALYTDIADSGMNPFVHWSLYGKHELRATIPFRQKVAKKRFCPKVSAIVPNYNHGRFLEQRLNSILAQTYQNIDILVLDDCSSDNSREVIDRFSEKYGNRIRKIYNVNNSGGVFKQWNKGLDNVDGEIVWICESDDFCEPDFVEKLVPFFADDSVQMAFGRILETDIEGTANLWLDTYREDAEAGIWAEQLVRPAADWFAHGFGVSNVIANVGGCLFRRAPIAQRVWDEAASFKVVGDWYLYLQIAGGGQIAWHPDAVSYFRRHGSNTSSSSFTGTRFYNELERVMIEMRKTWTIPDATTIKFYENIAKQYKYFDVEATHGVLDLHCNLDKMLSTRRQKSHILLAMLGFIPGGGENFPIQLANSLVEAGWIVSILVFNSEEVNEHMRRALNPAVSVYDAAWITEYGCGRAMRELGVSLIHSHTVGAEMHFYHMWNLDPALPYVVTLHGSYEASDIPFESMTRITSAIDHFVYTADKNLLPLQGQDIAPERFTKMANAMPIDPLPFPKTRADLGIAEDAIVFTLVARGIKRKGWRAAIEAFVAVRKRNPHSAMHLCLVGEGDEPDRHRKRYGKDPDISFLGYQARIHGLYRLSDVAVVPTRFAGESYPLCIIQALQVGTPVVASDVGEIENMLKDAHGACGGIIVKAVRDTATFIDSFAAAMEAILDDSLRARLAEQAQHLGRNYDMGPLVENYGKIYSQVLC